jgi:hypothetical protein
MCFYKTDLAGKVQKLPLLPGLTNVTRGLDNGQPFAVSGAHSFAGQILPTYAHFYHHGYFYR